MKGRKAFLGAVLLISTLILLGEYKMQENILQSQMKRYTAHG